MNISVKTAWNLNNVLVNISAWLLGWLFRRNDYNGTITRLSRVASALDVIPHGNLLPSK